MGAKAKGTQPPPGRAGRAWAFVGGAVLLAAVAASIWWVSTGQTASGGAPRLMVDRTEVDLGYLRYNVRAKAAFTLTNNGAGPVEIVDVSPVKALKGC